MYIDPRAGGRPLGCNDGCYKKLDMRDLGGISVSSTCLLVYNFTSLNLPLKRAEEERDRLYIRHLRYTS